MFIIKAFLKEGAPNILSRRSGVHGTHVALTLYMGVLRCSPAALKQNIIMVHTDILRMLYLRRDDDSDLQAAQTSWRRRTRELSVYGDHLPRLTWFAQDNNNNCFSFRSLQPRKSHYGYYTDEAFNRSTVVQSRRCRYAVQQ